jgi:hypothetical protein
MEAVVLNGARSGDEKVDEVSDAISSALGSLEQVSVFKLREIFIADCSSCFGCYLKTPGTCVINDAANGISKKLAKADLKVFLTPIVFGGYSSELKKAVDRQLGVLLPFCNKIQGEVHFLNRYERNGNLVGIGVLPKPDAESESIFKTLIDRNAITLHAPVHSTGFIYVEDNSSKIQDKIRNILAGVGFKN